MVIEYDPLTSEPYIRLPAPLSHIIVTPPRIQKARAAGDGRDENDGDDDGDGTPSEADIDASMLGLNDMRVHLWLQSTPYPYTRSDAVSWLTQSYHTSRGILDAEKSGVKWADGCPFSTIRDTTVSPNEGVNGDDKSSSAIAKAKKIGDFGIIRWGYWDLPVDSEERQMAIKRNAALAAGDEDIVWGLGFWLSPAYHRQGIMSASITATIESWGIPRMNLTTIKGCAFDGNLGSVGVMKKCGFAYERFIEKGTPVLSESRGGGKKDLHVLRWERPKRTES